MFQIVLKHMLASYGELYTVFAILAVRRSTKEVTSWGVCGDLQKNCPGSLCVVPYTTSAEEHLIPSYTAVRNPKSTKGKFSSQFDRFDIALEADFRLRRNLSTKLLLPESFINSPNKFYSNCRPMSVVIIARMPKRDTQPAMNVFAVV